METRPGTDKVKKVQLQSFLNVETRRITVSDYLTRRLKELAARKTETQGPPTSLFAQFKQLQPPPLRQGDPPSLQPIYIHTSTLHGLHSYTPTPTPSCCLVRSCQGGR
ncbi:hypothetical protein E2C01_085714 [Portunus trituberculatus]|uniref:Uncharacterized protein n=1 Tax=Portunus trituberculatus TaxID=210409 RepID=A0A5B7JBF1_PORTR|nr:hypothetical protein [Portunus trituberculatus]